MIIRSETLTKYRRQFRRAMHDFEILNFFAKEAKDTHETADCIQRQDQAEKNNRKHFARFYVLLPWNQEILFALHASEEAAGNGHETREHSSRPFTVTPGDKVQQLPREATRTVITNMSACNTRWRQKKPTYLPLRPARAVLPTLWMYCFSVGGRLALMTC